MKHRIKRSLLALVSVGLLTLVGCGGGGGGSDTDDVNITVIDGAIENATVCLDKNGNGACDLDEPAGRTNAAGKVTLKVNKADTGKFPVLAIADLDARDVDTGMVPVRFTLSAPADRTAIISPLTTLVQTVIEGSGLSSAAAEVQVRAQAGVIASLFDDFTAGKSPDQLAAGALARLIVVTTQQQTTALLSTINTNAIDGSKITPEKLDKIIKKKLLERIPALAAALPAVLAATSPVAKEAAVAAGASTLVSGNELPPASIGTLVAANNQGAATQNLTALQHAQNFVALFSASMATSYPSNGSLENAFVDSCSLSNGFTKTSSKALFDDNPARSIASNLFRVGSTRTNIQVVADRSITNADGSTRREIDVTYQVNYLDGTVAFDPSDIATLISGSSSGTVMQPGAVCATPQTGSNWRFLGNRRIVNIALRPNNDRYEQYSLATGAPVPYVVTSSPVAYSKYVQIIARDPSDFVKYVVVTGQGLPTAGLKMIAPRILRDDPLLAGKRGNFVDWQRNDSFRICRDSISGNRTAADVADCVVSGASSSNNGTFNTTPALADSGFDALGFVAGGTYTYKVYNDDGWKTVNGQSTQTPIATYTTTLRTLPYSAVALAGAGINSDLYPRLASSLSAVDIATAVRSKSAYSTNLSFTALGTMPDAAKYGFGDIYQYVEGRANANPPSGNFWPASRQVSQIVYPAAGALSVMNFSVPAPTSVLVSPTYSELGVELTNRNSQWVRSIWAFQ